MKLTNVNNSYYIKNSDTSSNIQLLVTDDMNVPVDLTTAHHIEIIIGVPEGRVLTKIPTVLEKPGTLEFNLDNGDILPTGDTRLEVHIYENATEKSVAPSKGFYKLRVQESIDTLNAEVSTYTLDYFLDQVSTATVGVEDLVSEGTSLVTLMGQALIETESITSETAIVKESAKIATENAEIATDNAISETSTLAQMKEDVIEATNSANDSSLAATESSTIANEKALLADEKAIFANEQGNYAKAEADRLAGTNVGVLDTKINTVNNTLSAQLAETTQEIDEKALSFYRNGNNKSIVTFIDDDGTKHFSERLKPVFDSEGVSCSIAVNPGFLGKVGPYSTRYVLDELIDLHNQGYEIVSHGYDHIGYNVDQTDAKLNKELSLSRDFLKEHGFNYKCIVYPDSLRPNDYRGMDFARKYYECGMATHEGVSNIAPIAQFNMKRYKIDTRSLATTKAIVDDALKNNEWIVFYTHAWDALITPAKIEEIRSLIQYIKSLNVEIVNVEEGMKRFGNVIDYQMDANTSLKISKTGKLKVNDAPIENNVRFLGTSPTENVNSLIADYDKGKISIQHIFANKNNPTPDKSGILITYRPPVFNDDTFAYQRWIDYITGNELVRFWNQGGSVWRTWESKNIVTLLGASSGTDINRPIADYPTGISTRTYANGISNAPTPNIGGICTTIKNYSTGTYSYQEWVDMWTGVKYIRFWNSTSSVWNEWIAK